MRCCSSVVQEFYHRWGAAAWLTTRSARVPRVRFRCGSGVVQVWLKYGSSVVEAWFKRGSSMAPSGGARSPAYTYFVTAKLREARSRAAPRGTARHLGARSAYQLGKTLLHSPTRNRTARHDAAPREPNGRHLGMKFACHAEKRIVEQCYARARRQPNARKRTAGCRCSAMLTRCALARRHFQRGGPFLSRTWR